MPAVCPQCSVLAPRVIIMSPDILDMAPDKRNAYETNEKSQHEPEFSTSERRESDHDHSSGCGCTNKRSSKLMYTAQGDKMFPSMRPWMISH